MADAQEPATGATAHVGYSHLFPGARMRVEAESGHGAIHHTPEEFGVEFSDGARSSARLLREDGESPPVLVVAGYTTARGTRVDERVWTVAAAVPADGGVDLRLGQRLPSG
ncbi:hypothetical protein [Nocardiopsis sp. MG754419]|uniref:hypothetical protein n=1 Tax=Nocardiopsis sp. MG754419 TaxID=2259865 RepID=UPI001BA463F7|nr:hypothetical protein [Nocardiopsis sp. MG754419]MBR8744356.1 hypothetical protein [Nocardiopsis sp. MG754419]